MLPLQDWPLDARRGIIGVFTDIDDTLTTEGAITSDALQALGDLAAAGLHVIPITGRPVGWSEPFAAVWPVDAIVAENGSVALTRGDGGISGKGAPLTPALSPEGRGSDSPDAADGNGRGGARHSREGGNPGLPDSSPLRKLYTQPEPIRHSNFARMQQVAQRILREVPGAKLSEDSPGRETDIAIDHSEFTHLPPSAIDEVVRIMRSEGMNATVSSIHINGWYGDHNKREGARWIVRELLARDLDVELGRWVYVGDSTNDVLMFEHFAHSVGVANIRRFEAQLTHAPRYVTPSERGAGFAEVARSILQARRGS